MSDWWAKKLGRAPAQQQPAAPTPQQWAQPPQQYQHQPGYPPQGYPPQPQPQYPQQQMPPQQAVPEGYVPVMQAANAWQGGQGMQLEGIQHCPACHSPNFFSRAYDENSMPLRGPAPAPHCNDCGYPIVQAGSKTGTLATVRATGPATPTRGVGQTTDLDFSKPFAKI